MHVYLFKNTLIYSVSPTSNSLSTIVALRKAWPTKLSYLPQNKKTKKQKQIQSKHSESGSSFLSRTQLFASCFKWSVTFISQSHEELLCCVDLQCHIKILSCPRVCTFSYNRQKRLNRYILQKSGQLQNIWMSTTGSWDTLFCSLSVFILNYWKGIKCQKAKRIMMLPISKCQSIALSIWPFFVVDFFFPIFCTSEKQLHISGFSWYEETKYSHLIAAFLSKQSNIVSFLLFATQTLTLSSLGACKYKPVATELLTFAYSKLLLILSKGRIL